MNAIAGLILAAGASRRMGQAKALLDYRGETFLGRLQRIYLANCQRVVVVLGHDAGLIRPLLADSVLPVVNPDPERGMLSSLQAGLSVLSGEPRILFQPLDYPAVREETVARLCAAPACEIVMPRFQGRRGHPVLISQRIAQEILELPVDAAARDVIRSRESEIAYVVVDDAAILMDVDTPEDYVRAIS